MKSKRLIQILVVFVLMVSAMGGSQSALASSNAAPHAEAMVINRNLNFWDATYIGFVNDSIHEKWHFDFTATHTFVVTATSVAGTSDLIPLLILGLVVGGVVALLRGQGRALPPTPSCPSCRRPIQAGWVACPYCGQNLTPGEITFPQDPGAVGGQG